MKKGAETIFLVFILVIAGFLGFVTFESGVVNAATYNVGSGVGNDTTSIQDAIDNFASDGDTVFVWGGTYYENVIVNKTITLMGEDRNLTIIHGNTNFDGVRVEDDWVNVTGFTITNGTYGVYVNASNNVRIEDNNISYNFQYGIYITLSSHNDITGNNVTFNNEDGIHLVDSTYNNIIDNNVIENDRDGIYLDASTNNNITNNFLLSNQDDGINLYIGSNQNNISYNNASTTSDDGIFLYTASDNTIAHNEVWNNSDGIFLYMSSHDNIVMDNDATSNRANGIYLEDSNNCNVTNNIAYDNNANGIYLEGSDSCNVTNNNVYDNNDYGIYVRSSQNCNVTNNNVYNNNADGIYIRSAQNCNVTNNVVSGNEDGFYIRQASNNIITNNEIYNNQDDGIYLTWGSSSNTIRNNNITDNIDGINLNGADGTMIFDNNVSYNADYGIYIGSSSDLIVTGNTMIEDGIFIFSNSFADWNSHTIDISNTANGKPVYYLKDQIGGFVPTGAGQVILVNCTSVLVFNQVLNNCSVGLELGYSDDNLIFDNSEASNIYGFYTYLSDGNSISGNSIENNRDRGIYIGFGNDNKIMGNNATGNYYGIVVRGASGTNVTGNNASGNIEGIYLESSNWNNITGNTFSYNTEYGIDLWDSYNNMLNENNVIGNENGIYLFASEDNLIYHNSIINNNNQSTDDSVGLNSWDDGYPYGGNYWSDWSPVTPDMYSGATTPQVSGSPDGICDTQYDIDADSIDYYPLKGPWDPTTTPPTVPLLLNATAGVTYVYLSWNPPADDGGLPVSNYRIFRGLISSGEVFLTEIDNILFYNDTAVNGGTTYFYKVSAVNIRGESPQSNEVNGTPLAPPDPPTGLALLSGNVFVNLSWFAPASDGGSAVTGYNIYRNGTLGVYDFVPAGQLWFNDTNVSNGLTYTYNITAVNSIGESLKSSDESATPMTLPTAPENLQTDAGDSYVNITWDVPVDDGGSAITGYNIYRNGTAGTYGTTTGETWFYDAGAVNGITYTYNVSAVNSVGEGPAVTISATPMTIPAVPENLQASAGDEVVHLTWEAPLDNGGSAITGYNIYRSDIAGVYATVPGGQLSFDDTNVINGVTYIYIISANNSVGEGPKTLEVNDVPMGAPSAPRNLEAEAGDGYVNLTWETPSDIGGSAITGYNIYRNGTAGVYDTVPAGQLWFYDDDAANGVEYTYDVAAVNIIGEGPDTSTSATPMTIPSAPQNLLAAVENGQIVLTWDTPVENGGSAIIEYHIYRDGTVTIFQTVSATELSYEDHDVTNGMTYTYYVSASNIVGEGPQSGGTNAKAGSGPAVPSNFTAAAGDSFVYLTWDIPASDGGYPVTNYTIYRGTTSGGETLLIVLGIDLSYNDTAAVNGVTYYYRISATNAIAESPPSNSVSATPQAPVIPVNEPPTSEITSPSDGDSLEGILDISGSSSDSDGTIQIVQIKIDNGNWITVSGTDSWTYSLDTTQLTDGDHTISVRSYDGENYSAETSISVSVANPEEEEEAEPESPMLWIIIIIIVIVLVLILLLAARKKKPAEEEGTAKPGEMEKVETGKEEPSEAPPPPPPWMEEKGEEPSEDTPPPPPWMEEEELPHDESPEEGEIEGEMPEEETAGEEGPTVDESEVQEEPNHPEGEDLKDEEGKPETEPTDEANTGEEGNTSDEAEEQKEEKDEPAM